MTSTTDAGRASFTLEKFAEHSFYHDVNRRLVALTRLAKGQRVVDLGAGTGAVTKLIAEEVANGNAEVIAIEPSESALEIARRSLEDFRGAVVRFIQGGAQILTQLVEKPVDAVFFCNAIHLVEEKDHVLHEILETLSDDGTFSFNTSFYLGAEPPEAELFYRRWMMKALRVLKKEYGLSPDKTRVEARHRLTEEEYMTLLTSNGLKVRDKEVVTVQVPLSGFEAISEYHLWIEGVLPGVPLAAGAHALTKAARLTFEELDVTEVPRNWLLVVADRA